MKNGKGGSPIRPETQRGIFVIILATLGVLGVLSFFGLAGSLGFYFRDLLDLSFGYGKYLVVAMLLISAFFLLNGWKEGVTKWRGGVGSFLFFILDLLAILELFGHGGAFGKILALPLLSISGFWASLLILIALLAIDLFLFFNVSFDNIRMVWAWIKDRLQEIFFSVRGKFDVDTEERMEEEDNTRGESEDEVVFSRSDIFGSSKEGPISLPKQLSLIPESKNVVARKKNGQFPLDLLQKVTGTPQSGDIHLQKERIRHTLENFGIEVEMGDVSVGPTVTQYTLKPAEGVKLSQITTLQNDLALALAAHPIRIEAPIPGKSLVGVEVPNRSVALVGLRGILESEYFKKRKGNLTLVFGRDVAGSPFGIDMDPLPHLLIAGATGSGKSVCINTLLISLLYQNSPENLRLILIDPKRVELSAYNGIPHLLTPVITDTERTINALRWTVHEMDRRYEILSQSGKRNIQTYNTFSQRMPYLVIVIDELADLMSTSANEVEAAIVRLAQMARAVGIHLVLATQRPSVDVITGLIKANITARLAFSVASQVDSRTILDYSGAEKLLGKGDFLYISASLSHPKRLQGAYVTEEELDQVTKFLKKESPEPQYNEEIITHQNQASTSHAGTFEGEEDEEILHQAKEVILQAGKASASLLQRRLKLGYARAARVLDILEERGFIGPGQGAKPREILSSEEAGHEV